MLIVWFDNYYSLFKYTMTIIGYIFTIKIVSFYLSAPNPCFFLNRWRLPTEGLGTFLKMLPHQPASAKHIRKLCKSLHSGCLELSALEFLKRVMYKWRADMKRCGGKKRKSNKKKNPEWAIHNHRRWGKPIFSTYKLCSLPPPPLWIHPRKRTADRQREEIGEKQE